MDPQQMKDMAGVLWSGAEGRTRITTESLNTLATAMYEAAEQIAEAPRWRDVVDELPQEAQEVLFVRGGKTVHGAWIGGIFWHSNQKCAAATWMPLPQPPKVGADSTAKTKRHNGEAHRRADSEAGRPSGGADCSTAT